MIDTIGIFIENQELSDLSSLKALNYNSNVNGEVVTYAKLNNLKVRQNDFGIGIKGSLPKYYFGNNLAILSRKETEEAINNISDELHLNINNGNVYRLDIGQNFTMKQDLSNYLALLGNSRYYKKTTFYDKETILYSNKQRAKEFYNKYKELKNKKVPIPEGFENENILRFETRVLKRLKNNFGDTVKVSRLYDESFYQKAIDKWQAEYFNIEKLKDKKLINPEEMKMMNVKRLLNQLSYIGLKQIGETELIEMLNIARQGKQIDRCVYGRLKTKIKELGNLPEFTSPNEAIEELDKKIIYATKHYR